MNKEIAFTALDKLLEWSGEAEGVSVLLFGGEPLLNWHVIVDFVNYAEERCSAIGKNLSWSMTTNGTLVDKEKARFLHDHNVSVMVSIDGVADMHNRYRRTCKGEPSFEAAYRGLKLLREYYERIDVHMTIMPDTIPLLHESLIFLSVEEGLGNVVVEPAMGVQWTKQSLDQLDKEMERSIAYLKTLPEEKRRRFSFLKDRLSERPFGCQAAFSSMAVTPEGDILPCSMFLCNRELRETYTLGNIRNRDMDLCRRAELITVNKWRGIKCAGCSLSPYCSGGCIAQNYNTTGSLVTPPDSICWHYKLIEKLTRAEEVTSN